MPSKQAGQSTTIQWERIAALIAALGIIALAVFLLIRNEAIADARLFFALRIVLSLGVAVIGATIPGFLSVGWSVRGIAVRAGGALALFVLTWLYTPDLVPTEAGAGPTTISAPGGVAAGQIHNSPITINRRGAP